MKQVVLIVLDGWGVGPRSPANPLSEANLPTLENIAKNFPSTLLQASGISVGLLWGEPGNSESGHLTLGAGRTLYQYLPRIILAIRSGAFFKNPVLLRAIRHAKTHDTRFHIFGLLSSGTVHSSIDHLYAILELAKQEGLAPHQIILHPFTDGRDSPPNDGTKQLKKLHTRLTEDKLGMIGSVMGRFFPMDRDENWERTQAAYELLTQGKGEKISDPSSYAASSYKSGVMDEFIKPAIVENPQSRAPLYITEGDSVLYFNYREDSARQLSRAFAEDGFSAFPRTPISGIYFCTLVQYEKSLPSDSAYLPTRITSPLGKVLSSARIRQLRIAETEKYAHVTYFFNGLREDPFEAENRILVKSLSVAHFDEHPKMEAEKLTRELVKKISSNTYRFILANYANVDMIGHTGNFESAIQAAETIDASLKKVVDAVLAKESSALLITADHGNVEDMRDLKSGEPKTEHTLNPVPLFLVGKGFQKTGTQTENKNPLFLTSAPTIKGLLADVAPTVLELLEIPKPPEMTGKSLLPVFENPVQ